ncbi:MAG: A/G-specific adenine glycosylase [Candidatus Anammoximicrobium sp.]|nr:A/G-specific adenine glycosylase [Candidatus Anammoximicrobium sp.]
MTDVSASLPDAAWKTRFRRRLIAWFRRSARDLPWRRTRDPYAVWISEIMLQQTQVVTVVGYFERFLAAFPTTAALAAADEQQVLRLWEGLGYYRRARQLHAAAKTILAEHGGVFPRDVQRIRALPGIGRYTAGAIASIAWDAPEPILEANTIRVFSRLLAYRGDPARNAGQRLLWDFSASVLPAKHSGLFNQALMELGSEICSPRDPQCGRCPVASLCPTRRQGLQAVIPLPKRKTAYEDRHETAVIVRRGARVALRRCAPGERWAGLWDFPRVTVTAQRGAALRDQLKSAVASLTGLAIEPGRRLTTIKHGVTRFRITLDCREARCVGGRLLPGGDVRWVKISDLESYPLSVTGRKIGRLLE